MVMEGIDADGATVGVFLIITPRKACGDLTGFRIEEAAAEVEGIIVIQHADL